MNELMNDIEKVLISSDEIASKIKEVSSQISKDYNGKEPLLVGILKGAVPFFADLIREIDLDLYIDFMAVSSYGKGTTSGTVKLVKDLSESVEGKDVIIVEDIVDTGKTLNYLKNKFLLDNAKSVKIACLLDKKDRREVELDADYVCFEIPDAFVVGFGLDYAEKYRGLKDVCVLKKSVYEKKILKNFLLPP